MKKKWLFGILMTALCVAFGIFLPSLVFSRTDMKTKNHYGGGYTLENSEGTESKSIVETMRNVSLGQNSYNYDTSMATMTEDDVESAAKEYLKGMNLEKLGYKIPDLDDETFTTSCELMMTFKDESYYELVRENLVYFDSSDTGNDETSEESNQSTASYDTVFSVVWRMDMEFSDSYNLVLSIDDESQKVIQIEFYNNGNADAEETSGESMDTYMDEVLIPFWTSYYGVEAERVDYTDANLVKMTDQEGESGIFSIYNSFGNFGTYFW